MDRIGDVHREDTVVSARPEAKPAGLEERPSVDPADQQVIAPSLGGASAKPDAGQNGHGPANLLHLSRAYERGNRHPGAGPVAGSPRPPLSAETGSRSTSTPAR